MDIRVLKLLLITSFILLPGCTIFSIKNRDPEGGIELLSEKSDNTLIPIGVIRGDDNWSGADLSQWKIGKQILNDTSQLSPFFIKNNIKKVLVKISVAKDLTDTWGPVPPILPDFSKGYIQVAWYDVTDLKNEKKFFAGQMSYKMYSFILFFPYGIYDILSRRVTGDWDSEAGVGQNIFSLRREQAAAELNRQMIKKIVANNFQIPKPN